MCSCSPRPSDFADSLLQPGTGRRYLGVISSPMDLPTAADRLRDATLSAPARAAQEYVADVLRVFANARLFGFSKVVVSSAELCEKMFRELLDAHGLGGLLRIAAEEEKETVAGGGGAAAGAPELQLVEAAHNPAALPPTQQLGLLETANPLAPPPKEMETQPAQPTPLPQAEGASLGAKETIPQLPAWYERRWIDEEESLRISAAFTRLPKRELKRARNGLRNALRNAWCPGAFRRHPKKRGITQVDFPSLDQETLGILKELTAHVI